MLKILSNPISRCAGHQATGMSHKRKRHALTAGRVRFHPAHGMLVYNMACILNYPGQSADYGRARTSCGVGQNRCAADPANNPMFSFSDICTRNFARGFTHLCMPKMHIHINTWVMHRSTCPKACHGILVSGTARRKWYRRRTWEVQVAAPTMPLSLIPQ
jgi:hypothetical protein